MVINLQLAATLCLLTGGTNNKVPCLDSIRTCVADLAKAEKEQEERDRHTFTANSEGCIAYYAEESISGPVGALKVTTEGLLLECGHAPGRKIFKRDAVQYRSTLGFSVVSVVGNYSTDAQIDTCFKKWAEKHP